MRQARARTMAMLETPATMIPTIRAENVLTSSPQPSSTPAIAAAPTRGRRTCWTITSSAVQASA